MSNALYDSARNKFLRGQYDWETISLRYILLNSGYTYQTYHTTYADIMAVGNVLAYSSAIAPATFTNTEGYATGRPYLFEDVLGGFPTTEENTVTQMIIAEDVLGDINQAVLIAFADNVLGFPIPADGKDYLFSGQSVSGITGVLFRI